MRQRTPKTFGQNDAIASSSTERAETFSEKNAKSATRNALPSAAAVLAYLRAQHPELGKPAALTARLPLPPLAMSAALAFVKRCVAEDTGTNPELVAAPEGYRLFLEHALVKAAPPELTAAAAAALLELVERFPATFAEPADAAAAVARAPALRRARRRADAASPRSCAACSRGGCARRPARRALLDELLALAGEGGAGAGASSDDRGGVFDAVHGRFEHQDGALRAAGFVAASGAVGDAGDSTFPPGRSRARAGFCRRRGARTRRWRAPPRRPSARRARGPAPSPRARLRNRARNRVRNSTRGDRGPGRRASAEGDAPERRRRARSARRARRGTSSPAGASGATPRSSWTACSR